MQGVRLQGVPREKDSQYVKEKLEEVDWAKVAAQEKCTGVVSMKTEWFYKDSEAYDSKECATWIAQ